MELSLIKEKEINKMDKMVNNANKYEMNFV